MEKVHQTFIPLETNEEFKFFCALNKSADRKVLFSKVLDYQTVIKAGSRIVVMSHFEKSAVNKKKDRRYRLYIDVTQANPLSRGHASPTNKGKIN